ncbi:MAG: Maf family nucleotide pyrophosphatase [Hyphomicrobiaceae bacterium]
MAEDTKIVLASSSAARRRLLEAAGLAFEVLASSVDEDSVRAALVDVDPVDVAEVLARAKTEDVAGRVDARVVIGADQVLALGEDILTKPQDMAEARAQLLALKGRRHQLHSAVAIAHDDEIAWVHVDTVEVTMRDYSPAFVGRYLSAAGDAALASVGCYQLEGPGVQLIEKISGDYFTVLGLPMMPLLAELRRMQVLDS